MSKGFKTRPFETRSFKCPFCHTANSSLEDTEKVHFLHLEKYLGSSYIWHHRIEGIDSLEEKDLGKMYPDSFAVTIRRCSSCGKYSILLKGLGEEFPFTETMAWPAHPLAIRFPEYVPKFIRNDYEEACSIVDLSPKASASLSRRCLQGMIRNFWNIDKPNLYSEIKALENNSELSALDQEVLHALRKLGNIGSHPEKDASLIIEVEPGEARQMVEMLEILINSWYVESHKKEELKRNLIATAASKRPQ